MRAEFHSRTASEVNFSSSGTNPIMAGFDDILIAVANDLVDAGQIETLGRNLGFRQAEITRYLDTNLRFSYVTSRGTLKMLRDWQQRVRQADERRLFREALVNSSLLRIADTHLPENQLTTSSQSSSATGHSGTVQPLFDPATHVTERQLLFVAERLLGDAYSSFGTALGFEYATYDNLKTMHHMNIKEATLELLHMWKTKSGGLKRDLDRALVEAQCGGLVEKYKEK